MRIGEEKGIGERIKKLRKEKKLTQKELAPKIGKSVRMLQKYEDGEVIPTFHQANIIANALDSDVNYILMGSAQTENFRPLVEENINGSNSLNIILTLYSTCGYKFTAGENGMRIESPSGEVTMLTANERKRYEKLLDGEIMDFLPDIHSKAWRAAKVLEETKEE